MQKIQDISVFMLHKCTLPASCNSSVPVCVRVFKDASKDMPQRSLWPCRVTQKLCVPTEPGSAVEGRVN